MLFFVDGWIISFEKKQGDHTMKSYWLLILIVVGFVLIIAGFVYNVVFAGIPYQDPPPDLVARYNLHATIAQTITTTGMIAMLVGIVGGVVLWLLRR